MALENVQPVRINTSQAQRYVVAEVSDGAKNTKVVIRGAFHQRPYEAIMLALTEEAAKEGCTVTVLGGGKVNVPEGKKIILYTDKSFGGDAEREKRTAPLLLEAFPGFTVECAGVN